MKKPIYLDYQATTPVDERVLAAMLPYFSEDFGNASSRPHVYGLKAKAAVAQARARVAGLLEVAPQNIIFNSGATEGNNQVFFGLFSQNPGQKKHVISSPVEHASVREPLHYWARQGLIDLTELSVDGQGQLDLEDLKKQVRPETILISIMAANHELGTLYDLAAIGKIAREAGVLFHSDGAQAVGKIPLDLGSLPVDFLSFSAHKIYGPKGVGALYINSQSLAETWSPLLHGGGQEQGRRSGTLNVPGIVGLGKAAQLAQELLPKEGARWRLWRDQLWQDLQQAIEGLKLNGSLQNRLPHNLHFSVAGVSSEALLSQIKSQLALSSGSACSSGFAGPSSVLQAIALSPEESKSSLRLALGRQTVASDLPIIVQSLAQAIHQLRSSVR